MDFALDRRDGFLAGAIIVFRALNEVLKEKSVPPARLRIAMQIATHLGLIQSILESIPVYWIEPEVDQLCQILTENFKFMSIGAQRRRSNGPLKGIQMIFGKEVEMSDQSKKNSIVAFFQATNTDHHINTIDHNCSCLYKLIDVGDENVDSVPANFSPSSKNRFIDFNKDLFNALELHIKCKTNGADGHQNLAWHPARLCLAEEKHDFPSISFLISPMQTDYWQDFHLIINPEDSAVGHDISPEPAFCNLVDLQLDARAEIGLDLSKCQFQIRNTDSFEPEPGLGNGKSLADVLKEYQLTPKDKIILAYAIALAYHHFYDSDLMRIKWTSETIWFMPPTKENGDIPLRPYLKFPFGTRKNPDEDFIQDAKLVHHHPRILAIGILLLEIGLSKRLPSILRGNPISQANCDHKIANRGLKDLEQVKWDGFAHESIFNKAVAYCILQGKLLEDYRNGKLDPVGKATNLSTKAPLEIPGILKRRQKFYKNVVLPLKYLAETGFEHKIGNTLYLRRKPRAASLEAELPLSNELLQLESSFHSGKTAKPEQWLKDLNLIGNTIEVQRRTRRLKAPIRVAILDTGILVNENDATTWRIKNKRDFVKNLSAETTDTFGHGTFMSRLIMNCAPSAEIIIARVAKDTKDLANSQENIKEAILWAGTECEADVISMSFGFPKDHGGIDAAIRKVEAERNGSVLLLASAGNSSFEYENFPARHPSVISIYAANCRGTFIETNPQIPDGASAIWGTYGSDIPDDYFTDVREKYPNVCQPGSSIATAIAAGICATMIAYADLLPYLEPSAQVEGRLSRLKLVRRKAGMEALFKSMVKKNDGSRMWFIDPISFWRDMSDQDSAGHHTRYTKIYSCLQDVSAQSAGNS